MSQQKQAHVQAQAQAQAQALAIQLPESLSVATLNTLSELFATLATQVANERMEYAHIAANREQVIQQRSAQISERLDVVSSAHQVAQQRIIDLTNENDTLKTEVVSLKASRRPAPNAKGSGTGDDNSEAVAKDSDADSNVEEAGDGQAPKKEVSLHAAARTSGQ